MSNRLHRRSIACALAALATCNFAAAADSDKAVDKRFKQESIACIQMKDRAAEQACKKEAEAARAEAKNDRLAKSDTDFAANAQARCKGLPAPEQRTCLARVHGEGVQSGSVAGGGVLRELTVPVAPDKPATAVTKP